MKSRCFRRTLTAMALGFAFSADGAEPAGERSALRITSGSLQFEERVIWDQGEYIYGIAAADLATISSKLWLCAFQFSIFALALISISLKQTLTMNGFSPFK